MRPQLSGWWEASGCRTPTPPALRKQHFDQIKHLLWGLGIFVFGFWSAAGQPLMSKLGFDFLPGKGGVKEMGEDWG